MSMSTDEKRALVKVRKGESVAFLLNLGRLDMAMLVDALAVLSPDSEDACERRDELLAEITDALDRDRAESEAKG